VALSAQTAAKVASKLAIAQKKRKLALRDDSVRPAFGRMSETGCQLFRRPRSQVRVEQGSCLTAGYCGSGRADDYTSLSATTSKLGCFGYIHDFLRSLLGWDQVKSSQVKSRGGAQDHRYGLSKGHITPLDTVEASGPTIGRHFQPQQANLVVLVTFTTFYAQVGGPLVFYCSWSLLPFEWLFGLSSRRLLEWQVCLLS
jgi:hypothetical protein